MSQASTTLSMHHPGGARLGLSVTWTVRVQASRQTMGRAKLTPCWQAGQVAAVAWAYGQGVGLPERLPDAD
jgi:hypothetical protein